MRQVTCEACGRTFEAQSPKAKFCSKPCRQRSSRHRAAGRIVEVHFGALPTAELEAEPTLTEATRATLAAAGRLASPQGRRAMILAREMDHPSPLTNGSQLAALSKAHGEALDAALKGAPRADDKLDELKARRARRVGA